ncbi:MAG: alpha/beta hydrolase-fold protein [Phycisphaerae bacterium]|nr:alpha/beta hydrolase-fold protein [Phycisphaerae bacterium]
MGITTSEVRFFSDALGGDSMLTVIAPDHCDRPMGVLYLLHGMGDDHTTWSSRVDIVGAMTIAQAEFMIVVPDAAGSYFCNIPGPDGGRYEDLIVRDVIRYIDAEYNTLAARRGRVAAGLSMGGYGSLMLSMRHPELFCGVSSHSASLYFGHEPHPFGKPYPTALMQSLKDETPDVDYDVFSLATRLAASETDEFPAIRFDCGLDDYQGDTNRRFRAHLDSLGVTNTYEEFPGGHTWDYWRANFDKTLNFTLDLFSGL